MSENRDEIRYQTEARRMYAALLGRSCPDCLLPRYVSAVEKLNLRLSEEEIRVHQLMMDRIQDLEALEMAARWTGRLPALVDKFRIMVLLAETLPENYQAFVSDRTRRVFGWLALIGAGIRSAWKLLKGLGLILRHYGAVKNG